MKKPNILELLKAVERYQRRLDKTGVRDYVEWRLALLTLKGELMLLGVEDMFEWEL